MPTLGLVSWPPMAEILSRAARWPVSPGGFSSGQEEHIPPIFAVAVLSVVCMREVGIRSSRVSVKDMDGEWKGAEV